MLAQRSFRTDTEVNLLLELIIGTYRKGRFRAGYRSNLGNRRFYRGRHFDRNRSYLYSTYISCLK